MHWQFPIVFNIASFSLSLHMITETLAFFVGFRYFLYLRKKFGDSISSSGRIWIVLGAIFGALIGSRLIGGLENPDELFASSNPLVYFYSNKTVVGGFLGGLAGVELAKKWIGEKRSSGDLFVYPIILALIIGRIGCFSMGIYEETYGLPSTLPWALDLGDGISRHPVSLYEIIFLMILWIMLKLTEHKYNLNSGGLFKLFMIFYLLFRCLLDIIKPHFSILLNLSTIQITCIAGLIYYLPYILKPRKLITSYA